MILDTHKTGRETCSFLNYFPGRHFDALSLRRPEMAFDLPGGARRLLQKASGYDATIVSGEVVMEHGEPTAARPGRLVRGAQPTPA